MAGKPGFASLRAEYADLWRLMSVIRTKIPAADGICQKIVQNRSRYEGVQRATGVPWYVVAVIHSMESGLNFNRHLHNGDPLTARTKQVPKGRPLTGNPPFTWEESAADALTLDGFPSNTDWSVEKIAYLLESFNGWGYRMYHSTVKSPYLWSFSNHYWYGKYVADGKWSDTAVSEQCGAMVLLKRLEAAGVVSFSAPLPRPRPEPVQPPRQPDDPGVSPAPSEPPSASPAATVATGGGLIAGAAIAASGEGTGAALWIGAAIFIAALVVGAIVIFRRRKE